MNKDVIAALAEQSAAILIKEAGLGSLAVQGLKGLGRVASAPLRHPGKTLAGLGGAYGLANLGQRGYNAIQAGQESPYDAFQRHNTAYQEQVKPVSNAIDRAIAGGNHSLAQELMQREQSGDMNIQANDPRTFMQKILPNWAGGTSLSSKQQADLDMRQQLQKELGQSGAGGSNWFTRTFNPWGSQPSAQENLNAANRAESAQQLKYDEAMREHAGAPGEYQKQIDQLKQLYTSPRVTPQRKQMLDQQLGELQRRMMGPQAKESPEAADIAEKMRSYGMNLQPYNRPQLHPAMQHPNMTMPGGGGMEYPGIGAGRGPGMPFQPGASKPFSYNEYAPRYLQPVGRDTLPAYAYPPRDIEDPNKPMTR